MSEEYISRKTVRDAIAALSIERFELTPAYRLYVEALDNVDKKVVKIPAADVAPVKHGRWIHKKDKRWMGGGKTVCSVCESGLSDGGYIAVRTFPYCPECGAKMDGGKNV